MNYLQRCLRDPKTADIDSLPIRVLALCSHYTVFRAKDPATIGSPLIYQESDHETNPSCRCRGFGLTQRAANGPSPDRDPRVYGRAGQPLNSADLLQLCTHDELGGVTARIFKDWGWKDLPYEAAPGAAVNVPFNLVCRCAKNQFNLQTIIKYRRPPNVEDQRDLYGMLLRNRVYAWTNFRRYLFEPAPAYSLLPAEGARTYFVRRSLFAGLGLSLVLLVLSLA